MLNFDLHGDLVYDKMIPRVKKSQANHAYDFEIN